MNLIVDVGNTRTKIAYFNNDKLKEVIITSHKETNKTIFSILANDLIYNAIVSSVGHKTIVDIHLFKEIKNVIDLDNTTKIPFTNHYKTPKTLGVDRIALAAAASKQFPKKNVLIIDAGTCITYDFLNHKNEYKGGAISPGIGIRFKALHDYTANLPLLEIDEFTLIGKNTEESIKSGVLNGVLQEINGIITQYEEKYSNLTIVLTGGNGNFLAKKLKSTIFANPNFLLEGLNSILIHNIDEWLKK